MTEIYATTLTNLALALAAGGLIGLERAYHGRPAGFRTHALVCLASALLMLLSVFQVQLLPGLPLETVRIDPTRMAQGIMTGIGFLGAGVIMKERLTIRGLTTAASIWMTASIGILIGVGFYFAGLVAATITLGVLSLFRWLEAFIPTVTYGRLEVRTPLAHPILEQELRDMVKAHGCGATSPSYHLHGEDRVMEFHMTVRTREKDNYRRLAETLAGHERVQGFNLAPVGD